MESNEAVKTAAEVTAEASATAPITSPPPLQATPTESTTPVVQIPPPTAEARSEEPEKKKRGRPRKYAPDGSVMTRPSPAATAPLNPMPISSSMPAGEIPVVMKQRNRGRPVGYLSSTTSSSSQMHHTSRIDFESPGTVVACSAGANFTPHIISVAAGEDVTMRIISFAQQGPRAICILSANGAISNVTLGQPDSSGGTMTYEGRFELLSLSGSFMPTDSGGSRSRSGGMSVSLASPDGRVIGGGVVGLLVAATPVQVIVGSFLPSYQTEHKSKKPRYETSFSMPATSIPGVIPNARMDDDRDTSIQLQHGAFSTPKPNLAPSVSFRGENNWTATLHSVPESRNNNNTDINL